MSLLEEADRCRRDARELKDKPEAPFLLKIASAFEELARMTEHMPVAPTQEDCCVR